MTFSHALDICTDQYFGQKVVDTENPQSYYLCLGFLGKLHNKCDEGFRFNGTQQRCVFSEKPKALVVAPANASDSEVGPKNVININQDIKMHKPIIFNIFGMPRGPTTIAPTTIPTGNHLRRLSNNL